MNVISRDNNKAELSDMLRFVVCFLLGNSPASEFLNVVCILHFPASEFLNVVCILLGNSSASEFSERFMLSSGLFPESEILKSRICYVLQLFANYLFIIIQNL